MSPVRRRKPKARKYENVVILVPGARADLIESEYVAALDPRTDPPTLHRELLDRLEAPGPVEMPAWFLGPDVARQCGGQDALVRLDGDETVTVIEAGEW